MQVKEKIFILKTLKYGESDLIVKGLSSDGAKKSFIAKGARKSKKRFSGGVLEPTHFIEVVYTNKNKENLDQLFVLTEAQLKRSFNKLREDYDRLEQAFYFLKVIEKLSVEGSEESQENYNLLGNALTALESTKSLPLLRIHFEMKLLHAQGVLPPELLIEEIVHRPIAQHEAIKHAVEEQQHDLELNLNHVVQSYIG